MKCAELDAQAWINLARLSRVHVNLGGVMKKIIASVVLGLSVLGCGAAATVPASASGAPVVYSHA